MDFNPFLVWADLSNLTLGISFDRLLFFFETESQYMCPPVRDIYVS